MRLNRSALPFVWGRYGRQKMWSMAWSASWSANLLDRKLGPLSVMTSSTATPMVWNHSRARSKNPTRVSAVSLSSAST